ncbi:hypothetical protein GN244_ATG17673 [Phytophthora infestans]|uniref:Uncharacterized protein n=1 Tax=Phytophthora infestans TaxID=4787 RepID=A0A833S8P9_PHYIN|nr:hypothetical protein GN244_ATG17673 [Phytophthora infestans]
MGNWDLSRIPSLGRQSGGRDRQQLWDRLLYSSGAGSQGAHVVLACRNAERAQAAVRAIKAELEPDPSPWNFCCWI